MDPTDWMFWWSLVVSIGVGYNFWNLYLRKRPTYKAPPFELYQVLAKQIPEYHWTPDGVGGARGKGLGFLVDVSAWGFEVKVYQDSPTRTLLFHASQLQWGTDLRAILVDYLTPTPRLPLVDYSIPPSEKRSLGEVTSDLPDQIPHIFKR